MPDKYISASREEIEAAGLLPAVDKYVSASAEDRKGMYVSASREDIADYYGIEPEGPEGPPKTPGTWEGISPEEEEFASKYPQVHAAGRLAWDFFSAAESVGKYLPTAITSPEEYKEQAERIYGLADALVRVTPFVRYTDPAEVDRLMSLSPSERAEALAWEAGEAALLMFPTQILKGLFKGVALPFKGARAGYKVLRPGFKFEPVEDALLKAKPFYAREHIYRGLKKAGFASDEAGAVMTQDPKELRHFFFEKMAAKGDVSPALRKAVRWQRGGARLSKETKAILDVSKQKAAHYQRQWDKVVRGHLGEEYTSAKAEGIFDNQVRATLGDKWVGKVTLETANEYYMSNFLRHAITHSKHLDQAVKSGNYNKWMFDYTSPVRVVLGSWDKRFGTYKNIYQKVIPKLEAKNRYSFAKLTVIAQMFKQRGLATWEVSKRGKLKFKPGFSEAEANRAFDVMKEADNLRGAGRGVPKAVTDTTKEIKELIRKQPEIIKKIIKTTRDFWNSMWAENVRIKIPQTLRKAGLTPKGTREVNEIERRLTKYLDQLFSTGSKATPLGRARASKAMYGKLREPLVAVRGRHPWFQAQGQQLDDTLARLRNEFTPAAEGGKGLGYLEDYIPRLTEGRNARFARWDRTLIGKMEAGYRKQRTAPVAYDTIGDLGASFERRISTQANDLILYPAVEEAVAYASKLPPKIRKYVDHWLSRALGRQSHVDMWVAEQFQKFLPFGKKLWTEERIAALARRTNDLAIVGGLGFKPFSAMRNMFQPLITVPAEMGGIQGFGHLLHGYKKALDPTFRQWVRDNGMIQEYAPEIYFTQRLMPWGKGVKWDQVRDAGLWMFSSADRANRYVSAGAAVHKWERALGTVGVTRPGVWNHAKFMKKSGGSAHYPWVRDEIDDLVRMGKLEEAKLVHTHNVVANTQFLYRPAESPIISQAGGALGKTGFLFQSWWANYGTLLEKWMRTGDAGEKANRMFTWMISSAIANQIMEPVWGRGTAARSTFFGPFPTTVDAMAMPPAWAPIYSTLNLIKSGVSPEVWAGDPDRLVKQFKALLQNLAIMVPGGLQLDQMARALAKEGPRGLPASIIRYQKAKRGEWPLWGALE